MKPIQQQQFRTSEFLGVETFNNEKFRIIQTENETITKYMTAPIFSHKADWFCRWNQSLGYNEKESEDGVRIILKLRSTACVW